MTIVEQLSAAQERIAELEASVKVSSEQTVAAEAKINAANEASVKAAADLKAATEKHAADLAEHGKVLEAEQLAHKSDAAELAKAKLALANPAFADAAIVGSKIPAADGGIPSSEVRMTKEQSESEYRRIEDARARSEYRKKNWALLGIPEEK